MDYQKMWESMKGTYQDRLDKLEAENKKGSTAWISAKRFVDVMTKFELVNAEESKGNTSDGMDDYHFRRYQESN